MDFCSGSQIELLCCISKATSLQEITDLGFTLMGNPIFIGDMSRTILAYSSAEISDEHWQRTTVNGDLERNGFKQSKEIDKVHNTSIAIRGPVLVEDDENPYPRLVKVLLEEDHPIGIVVVAGILKPITKEHYHLLELIASFVTLRTSKERYLFTNNQRSVNNFLLKLLDGAEMTADYVRKRLNILDWRYCKYIYVMVLKVEETHNTSGKEIDRIIETLTKIPHCRAFFYDNTILFIYSGNEQITDWSLEAPTIAEMFVRWGIKAGVSRCFTGVEKLYENYMQAKKSMWIGRKLERRERFFTYDSLSIFHMLEMISLHQSPRMFCHNKILELEKFDDPMKASLQITLQVYLEHTKSLMKTAEILQLHRNTVLYRIKKCKEIMDSDFNDNNDVFAFILSLRILEYERKIGHKQKTY